MKSRSALSAVLVAILLGLVFTLVPLALGATSSITYVMHSPMLLLDRWMVHHGIVINNGRRIQLFMAVNTIVWTSALLALGLVLISSLRFWKRQSHGNS